MSIEIELYKLTDELTCPEQMWMTGAEMEVAMAVAMAVEPKTVFP